MFFEKTTVTITNHLNDIQFLNVADTNHFNKYKLVNAYFEFPLEFRFCSNPENTNKSFKVALGFKVGILMDAHTKGKEWMNKNGNVVKVSGIIIFRKIKTNIFLIRKLVLWLPYV